jgi:predicted acetyltransferase
MTTFRAYDSEQDRDAAIRIWREVGWIEDDKKKREAFDLFVEGCRALVADVDGAAECLVLSMPGSLRYLEASLPFSAVVGVTTSRVVRKQGFAGRLTAQLIAEDVADGALVAGLGIFEQGFYDRLGFGSGGYEHWLAFDPAQLKVKRQHRIPQRLTLEDWQAVHVSRHARRQGHGAVNLDPQVVTQGEMMWTKNGFGLGYFDGPNGELTHHLWLRDSGNEHGPYTLLWLSYQTGDQFLELMALLKSLGDQVRMVWMREPPHIQMQDFLKQPFRFRQLTEKSKYENRMSATAYWQMRICDLPKCLAKTHVSGDVIRFNLTLSDPIEDFLGADAPWRGVAGSYVVTLGPESQAVRGDDPALPTLKASVNAFTRLWLGVRPATGLAVTDTLSGPPDLLKRLDNLRLPTPMPDWDF